MEWKEFCFKISDMLGLCRSKIQLACMEDRLIYVIEDVEYMYSIDDFEKLKQLAEQYDFDSYTLYNGIAYETMVNVVNSYSRRPFNYFWEDKLLGLSIKDETSHIDYSFKEVSNELIWYIIKDYDVSYRKYRGISYAYLDRKLATLENKDIFSLIKLITRFPLAMFIKSGSEMSKEQLKKRMESFLFNIAYNFDYVLKPVTEIEDIVPKRIHKIQYRAKKPEELVAPQLL